MSRAVWARMVLVRAVQLSNGFPMEPVQFKTVEGLACCSSSNRIAEPDPASPNFTADRIAVGIVALVFRALLYSRLEQFAHYIAFNLRSDRIGRDSAFENRNQGLAWKVDHQEEKAAADRCSSPDR